MGQPRWSLRIIRAEEEHIQSLLLEYDQRNHQVQERCAQVITNKLHTSHFFKKKTRVLWTHVFPTYCSYLEDLENNPDIDRNQTLGSFVQSRGYSELFQKAYLVRGFEYILLCSFGYGSNLLMCFFQYFD